MPKVKFDAAALSTAKLLQICAQEADVTKARVSNQTGQGRDANGGALKPYSAAYAKKKAESGRSTITNLTWTRDLLGSVQTRTVSDGAEIYFLGDHSVKRPKKPRKGGAKKLTNAALATYLIAKGFVEWFVFGTPDIKRIEKRFINEVENASKKLIVVK